MVIDPLSMERLEDAIDSETEDATRLDPKAKVWGDVTELGIVDLANEDGGETVESWDTDEKLRAASSVEILPGTVSKVEL